MLHACFAKRAPQHTSITVCEACPQGLLTSLVPPLSTLITILIGGTPGSQVVRVEDVMATAAKAQGGMLERAQGGMLERAGHCRV